MKRHDLIFDITYSYYLEKMFSTLNGRIDKLLTLVILSSCLGAFSDIFSIKWLAALIGFLSLLQIIFQFAKQGGVAQEQARKYLSLSVDANDINEDELGERFKALQNSDSDPWLIFSNAAYKRTCITLGLEDPSEPLTKTEKILALLAGNLPRQGINHSQSTRKS